MEITYDGQLIKYNKILLYLKQKTALKMLFFGMLAVRYISGNNFSITERGILENWATIQPNMEKVRCLIEK